MATELGIKFLTIADWARRLDPDGGVSMVIEQIAETNPLLQDASAMEGNLPTGHRSTVRTTQPAGTRRQFNAGVAETKSTTRQVDDGLEMLEAYSAVDVALAELNGNSAAFRASEDAAFMAGLSEDAVDDVLYANSGVTPERMHGLTPRYSSLSTGTSNYVINGAGSSALTSLWLITWGEKTTTLIYPKGSVAGLKRQDLGERPWDDGSGNPYQAYVTHFVWKIGLAVPDYRYNIRICNIATGDLTVDASTGVDLMKNMVDAYWKRPTEALGSMNRTYWYCNRTIGQYLHHQASNKSNVNLTMDNPAGTPIIRFLGAPIRICDAITSSETVVA
ncbi:hypothetical protein LCGC14_0365550 [marine sediment metagenome]|uniref:Major capsid protein n=1 Tax=marine sediment metagenome TaxID=412755 RepID=A0A0F9TCL7_9ZZZZ